MAAVRTPGWRGAGQCHRPIVGAEEDAPVGQQWQGTQQVLVVGDDAHIHRVCFVDLGLELFGQAPQSGIEVLHRRLAASSKNSRRAIWS